MRIRTMIPYSSTLIGLPLCWKCDFLDDYIDSDYFAQTIQELRTIYLIISNFFVVSLPANPAMATPGTNSAFEQKSKRKKRWVKNTGTERFYHRLQPSNGKGQTYDMSFDFSTTVLVRWAYFHTMYVHIDTQSLCWLHVSVLCYFSHPGPCVWLALQEWGLGKSW